MGLLELEDAETGGRLLLDTGSRRVREAFVLAARQRREALQGLVHSSGADLIEVSTDGSHLDALIRFFRFRGTAEEDMKCVFCVASFARRTHEQAGLVPPTRRWPPIWLSLAHAFSGCRVRAKER